VVLVLDVDMIACAERSPEDFVEKLKLAVRERRYHNVSVEGRTVGDVVWYGRMSDSPTLQINGLRAEVISHGGT
jgi:hypothetical protein